MPHRHDDQTPARVSSSPRMRLDVADAVRLARLRVRMTQAELGSAMGWSRQLVTKIEAGERAVHLDEVPVLCRVLRCTLGDLLADVGGRDRAAMGLPPVGRTSL